MRWIILIFGLPLVGCGGADGGDIGGGDRLAAFDRLAADAAALDVTATAQFPMSGQVGYTGAAVLDLPIDGARVAFIADLVIRVSFGAGDAVVDGSLGAFTADNGGTLAGALAISDGEIFENADPDLDYQFTASVAGTLSDQAVAHGISGTLAGDFRGRDAGAMAGVIFGDITSEGMVDIFDGVFAGMRQP
ncbi:hypothetical protein [Yoonia sp.]|uniref:hypothetical protein n=1 Tax=Yoonia sp. TaxID=2212373 RepID=UPI003F6D5D81